MAKTSYALPTETIPALSINSILADLNEFVSLLEKYGIETNNTRISRYVEYLDALSEEDEITLQNTFANSANQQPDHLFNTTHELDHYLYVLREVGELNWILAGIKKHEPENLRKKLSILTSGNDFATLDKASSHARDTQFELRIASYFCQKGYTVTLSQTDIIACKGRVRVYVECKRVGSSSKLKQRIKEAKKQLDNRLPKNTLFRKYYGIIAVDVTKVAYNHSGLTWAKTSEHGRDLLQDKLRGISDSSERFNLRAFQDRRVVFIWYQILMPQLVEYPLMLAARFSSFFEFNPLMIFRGTRQRRNICRDVSSVIPDPRVRQPVDLKPRSTLKVPAGSELSFEEAVFSSFFEDFRVPEMKDSVVIITLIIENKEHEFFLFELKEYLSSLSQEGKVRLQEYQDKTHAIMEIACVLYVRRHPFEE